MHPRQLLILFSDEPRPFNEDVLLIGGEGIAFNQAANLLGQEFSAIEFDARTGFHLEALAIAAGTIKQGGKLYLRLPSWHSLESRLDQDSLRWAGESTAIASPTFARYFKRLIERFGFYPVQQTTPLPVLNSLNGQQIILQRLPQQIHYRPPMSNRPCLNKFYGDKKKFICSPLSGGGVSRHYWGYWPINYMNLFI